MAITLTVDFPPEIEAQLRSEAELIATDVKQAFVVQLFRRGRLTHFQLSQVLGLDRFETDAVLKRFGVSCGAPTFEDIETDRRTVEALLAKSNL